MKKQILFSLLLIPLTSSAMKRKHDHQELAIIKKQEPVRPTLASLWNGDCDNNLLTHIPSTIIKVSIGDSDQAIADITTFMQINRLSQEILCTNNYSLLMQLAKEIQQKNDLTLYKVQQQRLSFGAHLPNARNFAYLLRTTQIMINTGLFDPFHRPHIFCYLPLQTVVDANDLPLAKLLHKQNPAAYQQPYQLAMCVLYAADKRDWNPEDPYSDTDSFVTLLTHCQTRPLQAITN